MLSEGQIDGILEAVLPERVWALCSGRGLGTQLARYLELLERWNRVVSLTSVCGDEEVLRRHIAEGFCCGAALPDCGEMLDLGSGGGFPGMPVQLLRPEVRVTMAESHARKAAFLREVVRELGLGSRVFAGRAQELESRSFGCVCLRAVDPMEQALAAAAELARDWVCVLGAESMEKAYGAGLLGWELAGRDVMLGDGNSVLFRFRRVGGVPRGT